MLSYEQMNELASKAPIGSDGILVFPFGNGAERMLENQDLGGSFHGLNLTRHANSHLCRAVQEGIVFSLAYGFEILNGMGIEAKTVRAGQANMFLSDIFCEAFCNVTGDTIELVNTDGAQGAARAAGVGLGYYKNMEDAFSGLACLKRYEPNTSLQKEYQQAYSAWKALLEKQLKTKH
jgi:xylulokinase